MLTSMTYSFFPCPVKRSEAKRSERSELRLSVYMCKFDTFVMLSTGKPQGNLPYLMQLGGILYYFVYEKIVFVYEALLYTLIL